MDHLGSRVKQISSELKEYFETRIDLLVLNISEQLTGWLGESIQKIIGFIIIGIGLFFTLNALAIYLGDLLDNEAIGYIIVAIPMLIIGLIFVMSGKRGLAKSIQKQFMAEVIKSLEEDQKKPELPAHTNQKTEQEYEQKVG